MRKLENHYCGVYAIRNKVTNRSYIGQSEDTHTRWMDHKWDLNNHVHPNQDLQKDWDTFGESNFEHYVLFECPKEQLRDCEIKMIGLFDTTNPEHGYNLVGYDGIANTRDVIRKAKREALRKHFKEHPELAEKRFKAVAEAIRRPETRMKLSEKMIQKHKETEYAANFKKRNEDPDYRKKISEAHKGMRPSRESILKIKETLGKPVRCIETGAVYISAREAARQIPGNVNINAVLNGTRKTAGGYHWERVE